MNQHLRRILYVSWAIPAFVLWSNTAISAETHTIVGTQQLTWTYMERASTPTTALVVDDLAIGDFVEIKIPGGPIPHGFITLIKNGDGSFTESKDLVQTCDDGNGAKPNAVLKETGCTGASQFGKRFKGSMKLEVLKAFTGDVNFWCVVHKGSMPGMLRLKAV